MKIIAAIDGTKSSEAAVNCLIGMDLAPDTEIKLLTILRAEEISLPFMKKSSTAGNPSDLMEAAKTALEEMVAELQKLLNGCTITFELMQGEAKAKIVEVARQWKADIIIMGSRGHKGMDLVLLGSVSQGVLMQSPCPVLVVKIDDTKNPEEFRHGFKRVLFTADNSAYSKAAFDWLKKIKFAAKTDFKLITVVPLLTDYLSDEHQANNLPELMADHDIVKGKADTELKTLAADLETAFADSEVATEVAEGDPREVILQIASSWSADLIVMGSHGRSGLTKLLLGSVSQAVAVHSPCAVAIVRGLAQKGRDEMKMTGRFA